MSEDICEEWKCNNCEVLVVEECAGDTILSVLTDEKIHKRVKGSQDKCETYIRLLASNLEAVILIYR